MHILAVDTSGGVCSAAVLYDNKILSEAYMNDKRTHSETIGPMIDFCLSCANIDIKEVDLFACASGPGSFTGLRIGIGMMKAFAHASLKPVLGINTLDALAFNALGTDEIVCPVIDARRGEVYTATYQNGRRISEYRAVPLDDVLSELQGRQTVFLGDATVVHKEKILSTDSVFRIAHEGIVLQRAGSVGLAAFVQYQTGIHQDAYSLEPFYLRETQAERVRAKMNQQ
jgi:tRNA threonylcarbamoyladenosine biosynthesis protein TsaB